MKSGVYMLRNVKNGKFYIGSAYDLQKRYNDHFAKLRNNKHHNRYVQSAYNLDSEYFVFGIIEYAPKEDVLRLEAEYIEKLNPDYNFVRFIEQTKIMPPWTVDRKIERRNRNGRGEVGMYDLTGNLIMTFNFRREAAEFIDHEYTTFNKRVNKYIVKKKYAFFDFPGKAPDKVPVEMIPSKIQHGGYTAKKVSVYKKDVFIGEFASLREASKRVGKNNTQMFKWMTGAKKSREGYKVKYV